MKRTIIPIALLFLGMISCNGDPEASDAFGNFEAVDVLVSAEGQGRLLQFNVEEGKHLYQGDVAGIIDTMQLHLKKLQLLQGIATVETRQATLVAQVRTYRVKLNNLDRELDRVRQLLEDGAATGKQKDDLQGSRDELLAQIEVLNTQSATIRAEKESLQVQVLQVEDQLLRAHVVNPIEGTVLQKYKEEGEIVAPGQILYKIADLSKLILRVYVSGDQLSGIRINEKVTVRVDTADGIRELEGTVSWVSSTAEFTPKVIQTKEERVNLVYAVKVLVENDGTLKIGMPGEIKI